MYEGPLQKAAEAYIKAVLEEKERQKKLEEERIKNREILRQKLENQKMLEEQNEGNVVLNNKNGKYISTAQSKIQKKRKKRKSKNQIPIQVSSDSPNSSTSDDEMISTLRTRNFPINESTDNNTLPPVRTPISTLTDTSQTPIPLLDRNGKVKLVRSSNSALANLMSTNSKHNHDSDDSYFKDDISSAPRSLSSLYKPQKRKAAAGKGDLLEPDEFNELSRDSRALDSSDVLNRKEHQKEVRKLSREMNSDSGPVSGSVPGSVSDSEEDVDLENVENSDPENGLGSPFKFQRPSKFMSGTELSSNSVNLSEHPQLSYFTDSYSPSYGSGSLSAHVPEHVPDSVQYSVHSSDAYSDTSDVSTNQALASGVHVAQNDELGRELDSILMRNAEEARSAKGKRRKSQGTKISKSLSTEAVINEIPHTDTHTISILNKDIENADDIDPFLNEGEVFSDSNTGDFEPRKSESDADFGSDIFVNNSNLSSSVPIRRLIKKRKDSDSTESALHSLYDFRSNKENRRPTKSADSTRDSKSLKKKRSSASKQEKVKDVQSDSPKSSKSHSKSRKSGKRSKKSNDDYSYSTNEKSVLSLPPNDKTSTILSSRKGNDNKSSPFVRRHLQIDSDSFINGQLNIDSDSFVRGQLNIDSDSFVKGQLPIDSDSFAKGQLPIDSDSFAKGQLPIDSDSFAKGQLPIDSDSFVKGQLPIDSDSFINGQLNIDSDSFVKSQNQINSGSTHQSELSDVSSLSSSVYRRKAQISEETESKPKRKQRQKKGKKHSSANDVIPVRPDELPTITMTTNMGEEKNNAFRMDRYNETVPTVPKEKLIQRKDKFSPSVKTPNEPVKGWYKFQVALIPEPDTNDIERKASNTFDFEHLMKQMRENT